jgi:hypothetical protein
LWKTATPVILKIYYKTFIFRLISVENFDFSGIIKEIKVGGKKEVSDV